MVMLHYIFDPLCGWCYGAAPLVRAARQVPGLRIAIHGGGMLAGPNRRKVTPQWRDRVMAFDRRIAQVSGQSFGTAYQEGLLYDSGATLDSVPPITAILAADAIDGRGLDMIDRMQRAHFVEGLRIAEAAVIIRLAGEMGFDLATFAEFFRKLTGAATERHINESRSLLTMLGRSGFPAFALEATAEHLIPVDVDPWFGRPQEWAAELARLTA